MLLMTLTPRAIAEESPNIHQNPTDASPTQPLSETILDTQSPNPLLTSRPSVTDAAVTVPDGSLQIESGATYSQLTSKHSLWTLPETLIRLGITPNTELRLNAPNLNSNREQTLLTSSQQFGDVAVGFAHHWRLPGNIDMSLIPMLSLPSGANTLSSQGIDPDIRLTVAKSVSPKLTLSSQFEARLNTNHHAVAEAIFTPTLIAYYQHTPVLCSFWEYAAFIPTQGSTQHLLQSGLLYVIRKRHQLDVRVGAGLSENSPHYLIGFGYSFRIDGLFHH